MVVIDAVMRLIPASWATPRAPSTSRSGPTAAWNIPSTPGPASSAGLTVPEILLSGDHAAIARWRREHRR